MWKIPSLSFRLSNIEFYVPRWRFEIKKFPKVFVTYHDQTFFSTETTELQRLSEPKFVLDSNQFEQKKGEKSTRVVSKRAENDIQTCVYLLKVNKNFGKSNFTSE